MDNIINTGSFQINKDNIKTCSYCILTEEDFNSDELKSFLAIKEGKSLQDFIRNESYDKHKKGEEKCYLIKIDNHVVAYFTLCTDLIIERNEIEKLSSNDRTTVDKMITILKSNDGDIDKLNFFEKSLNNFDELVEIAYKIFNAEERIKEYKATNSKVRDVARAYPSLSIKKFCKNVKYKNLVDMKIGTYYFWKIIVEVIKELHKKIGFVYVSIFASEEDRHIESQSNDERLINYYKNELRFNYGDNTKEFIRQFYERGCEALYQTADSLFEAQKGYLEQIIIENK